LVDLPGYGFAQAGKKQRAKLKTMIERYCLLREALVSLFVLIDCRHEPQQIDLEFMEWLGEQAIPFAIVFTKADKLTKSKLTMNVNSYKEKLQEVWEELPPIFVTSAEKGLGEQELISYIEGINRDIANQS
jgi:GTP-binding protein